MSLFSKQQFRSAFVISTALCICGCGTPRASQTLARNAPDLGAFEVGQPPLEFGRRAYFKWNEGWAPWETVR